MARVSFFERMEREINFYDEYTKIECIVLNEHGYRHETLNQEMSREFRKWKGRRNYTSLYELREQLGFCYIEDTIERKLLLPTGQINGMDDFLLYCEMMINLFAIMSDKNCRYENLERIDTMVETMRYDIERINHEIRRIENDKFIIVQKDAAASAVADIVEPDLGNSIIEYNHYRLRGDVESKKIILKKIADALEPMKTELKNADKKLENDFFYLVNNMDIRHNNCNPADKSKYNEKFARLLAREKEEWYDEIYQEGLMAFLTLQQVGRTKKIEEFKKL